MKHLKHILTVALTMLVALAVAVPAFADPSYTITIDNGVNGQKYQAYKVFDVTLADTNTSDQTDYDAFSYSISTNNPWFDVLTGHASGASYANSYTPASGSSAYGLTFTKSAGDATTYVVTFDSTNFRATSFAQLLNNNKANKTVAASINSYSSSAKTMTVTELGYYFVDSSMGSVCSLDTTATDVTIYEKNSTPTLAKKVAEDQTIVTVDTATSTANGTYPADSTAAQANTVNWSDFASGDVGQTIFFKLTANTGSIYSAYASPKTDDTATHGTGLTSDYVITDTLPGGMSYNGVTSAAAATKAAENVYVTVDGTNWTLGTDYTVAYANDVLTIILKQTKLATLAENKDIVITYGATVDEDAVIGGTGNTNKATLSYTGDEIAYTTPEVKSTVYVSATALYKFNSKAQELATAKFTVKTPENVSMYFKQMNAGSATEPAVYIYNAAYAQGQTDIVSEITTPASGSIVIYGLDTGTYTFTETHAPLGYNLLTTNPTVEVKYAADVLSADKAFNTSSTPAATATFEHGTDDTTGKGTVGAVTYKLNGDSVMGVENLTGAELPSTGGIGTTLFYIIGGAMVLTAAVVLITKRRLASIEQ